VPLMMCDYGLSNGQYALRVTKLLNSYEPDVARAKQS